MSDGVLNGPGEGERFDDDVRVAIIKAALPHLTVLEFNVTGGDDYGPDPHTHDDHTDSFFVIEGEVEITLGEKTFTAGPGTFVAAPPGVLHGFKVPNPPARFLNVHAPGGFEHVMRRMNAD